MRRVRAHGFTLLELVIAVAIFALVGAMAYGGLLVMLQGDARVRERAALLADVQVTLAVLERDLRQTVTVGYRDRFGDPQPPLAFSPLADAPELRMVRAGGGGREPLRRVTWRVTEKGLERQLWEALDAGSDGFVQSRVFLGGSARGAGESEAASDAVRVSEPRQAVQLALRFVSRTSEGLQRLDTWPPPGAPVSRGDLPALVEVYLDVPGLGRVERHFALPEPAGAEG